MHDDMQAMRVLQMDRCIRDFQIPCRWVPDMGFGFGYPQFNYYAPLPYYIMEIFHLAGIQIITSVKIYLIIISILAAAGMYWLSGVFWKNKFAGVISALFYIYLPYKFVNIYVRGSISELTAQAVMPYVLLFAYKVINSNNKRYVYFLTLSLSALMLSHNISALLFTPFLFLFITFIIPSSGKSLKKGLVDIGISFIGAVIFSAFFIIPAFLERNLVHISTLTSNYFDFRGHFLNIRQILFSGNWGYGSSQPGEHDQLMLGIGFLYWFFPLIALIVGFFMKQYGRSKLLFLSLLAWFSLFLTHSKSIFIWNSIPILKYVQFPWRFHAFAGMFFCLAVGFIGSLSAGKYAKTSVFILFTVLILIFYGKFPRPDKWFEISDSQKFTGANWELQQTVSINDYLPVYSELSPKEEAKSEPVLLTGKMDILTIDKGSDWQKWQVKVYENSKIQAQVFYFPNWKVFIDGRLTKFEYNNPNGLITFDLNEGSHEVLLRLTDTPIRIIANLITLLGIPFYFITLKKFNYEK